MFDTMPRIAYLPLILVAVATTETTARAQGTHAVSGTTVDSASGLPLAGALVDLRSATDRRAVRTDEAGLFRITGLAPGRYQISVLRIGFAELKRDLELGDSDAVLTLRMRSVAQRLEGFRVRGDISAIYGMVGSLPDLLPIAGAKVQVLGTNKSQVTDSMGGFFIPTDNPGSYLVRMSHEGFVDRLFPVEVPRDKAVEASRMLDPGPGTPKAMDHLFVDADQRLRYRGMNSTIVPGAELRKVGGSLRTALMFAPSMARQGLHISGGACLFVNGVLKKINPLDMYQPDEIEAIEVYGPNGDKTDDLQRQCDPNRPMSGALTRRPSVSGNNIVQYIVIWLRK